MTIVFNAKARVIGVRVPSFIEVLERWQILGPKVPRQFVPRCPSYSNGVGVPPVLWTVMGLEIPALQRQSFRS
ncbi:hypothetical protein POI8812_03544 [Pontivivens insulae]|uniref:Uncharacterized protein n=1 Tax=Pontivivens insulae TaxID=1639689 RepID=A0A2R8AG19_9RHOB|nr:hypothetical protein DFR53_3532 [Pontivivens insulae]SPF31193.1 hypothetical protein POI8812_03544 [Pontivivens insulae]